MSICVVLPWTSLLFSYSLHWNKTDIEWTQWHHHIFTPPMTGHPWWFLATFLGQTMTQWGDIFHREDFVTWWVSLVSWRRFPLVADDCVGEAGRHRWSTQWILKWKTKQGAKISKGNMATYESPHFIPSIFLLYVCLLHEIPSNKHQSNFSFASNTVHVLIQVCCFSSLYPQPSLLQTYMESATVLSVPHYYVIYPSK